MKSQRFFFIATLLVFYINCFAQYDFRKGYVVTNNNDTITGFIDYNNTYTASTKCVFKKDLNSSDAFTYSPNQLKEYRITDAKYFISKNVTINDSTQTFFLEYLLNGKVNLYFLETPNKYRYFLIEKENVLYALTNNEVHHTVDGKVILQNSNKYIGVLRFLMQDSPSISSKIESVKFNHQSLIQLTKEYNESICDNEKCVIYFKKQDKLNDTKWQFHYGVLLESNWMSLEQNSQLSGYMVGYNALGSVVATKTNTQFSSNYQGFIPGLFLNVSRNTKFSLELQLKYQDIRFTQLQTKRIQLPILFSFDLLRYKKLIPYLTVGFGNDIYLDYKFTEKQYVDYNKFETYYDGTKFISITNSYTANFEDKEVFKPRYSRSYIFGYGLKYYLQNKNAIKFNIVGSIYSVDSYSNRTTLPYLFTKSSFASISAIASYQF